MIFIFLSIIINMQEPLQTTGLLYMENCDLWIEFPNDSFNISIDTTIWGTIDTILIKKYPFNINIRGIILKNEDCDSLIYLTFREYIQKVLNDKAMITYIFIEFNKNRKRYQKISQNIDWKYNHISIGYYLKANK